MWMHGVRRNRNAMEYKGTRKGHRKKEKSHACMCFGRIRLKELQRFKSDTHVGKVSWRLACYILKKYSPTLNIYIKCHIEIIEYHIWSYISVCDANIKGLTSTCFTCWQKRKTLCVHGMTAATIAGTFTTSTQAHSNRTFLVCKGRQSVIYSLKPVDAVIAALYPPWVEEISAGLSLDAGVRMEKCRSK